MSDTLTRQMRKGVLWGAANSMVLRAGSFIVGIITARLIAPEQFGVFAVALTAFSVVIHVSELGVSAVLMRATEGVDELAPTVATISILSSVALTAGMYFVAPTVAVALGAPEATTPIRIIASCVLLAGVSAVSNALLVREFRQDILALSQGASFVVSTGVVVVLALNGGGAVALALSQVAGRVVGTAIIMAMAPKWYWPGLNRARIGELLRFGLPLAGANLFGFSVLNVDYIVIGHIEGAVALGLYMLAFNISGWPSSVLNAMVNSVAMPAFARIRNDRERLPHFLGTTLSAVATLTLPVSVLLAVLARPVVLAVYGSEWSGAIAALAALAAFGAFRVGSELFANVIVALGRPRTLFVVQVGWLVLLIPAMYAGVMRWGIVGAGYAHLAVIALFVMPVYLASLKSLTAIRLSDLFGAIVRPLVASAAAGIVAYAVTELLDGVWLTLMVGTVSALVVYAAMVGRWAFRMQKDARALWNSVQPEPEGADALDPAIGGPNDAAATA